MLNRITRLLNLGTDPDYGDIENRSISFSNGVYVTLPVVYIVFIILQIEDYLVPPSELVWDQFIVPLFVVFCGFFLYLNRIKKTLLSRLSLLLTWPLLFHIIPIIQQNSPDDYYIAYPFGLVFHGIMIHALISRKNYPILYWSLVLINFLAVINIMDVLHSFDVDKTYESVMIFGNRLYGMVGLLYWLLFNLTTFYLVEAMDINLNRMSTDKELIEHQRNEIRESFEKLRETQSQLVQSEKQASIGTLVSGMAHELNNPLNIVSGGLEVIEKSLSKVLTDKPLDDIEKEDLNTMIGSSKHSIERASKIVKSLMLSVKESNRPTEYSLREIIENVMQLLHYKLQNIKTTLDLREVNIECYPNKIQMIVSEIIENAIYWSGRSKSEPEIKIELTERFDKASIAISNNGPAIPKEALSKLFDPFFSSKETGEGTGLGLYHCYQFAHEHGGEISVSSTEGFVKFEIILPSKISTSVHN